MPRHLRGVVTALSLMLVLAWSPASAKESNCITCHRNVTPNIVKDFLDGAMGKSGSVDCSDCHGKAHEGAADVAKVKLPTEVM